MAIRIVDVTDDAAFALIPPCADPGFDHRSCDYWEDADRGSKAARLVLARGAAPARAAPPRRAAAQPVRADDDASRRSTRSPAPSHAAGPFNPFADDDDEPVDNPFAPRREPRPGRRRRTRRPSSGCSARGLAVFGSYAKVLAATTTSRPRTRSSGRCPRIRGRCAPASSIRSLPDAPLPAVITCIATTPAARGRGLAATLVEAVVRRPRGPRLRGGRGLPGGRRADRTRPAPRTPGVLGGAAGSPSRPPTTASRSCAGSSREATAAGIARVLVAIARRRLRCRRRPLADPRSPRRRRAAGPRRAARPGRRPTRRPRRPRLDAPPAAGRRSTTSLLALPARRRRRRPGRPEPDAFAEAARGPATSPRNVDGGRVRGRRSTADDLASGVVAQLRPGVFDDGAVPRLARHLRRGRVRARPAASPATPRPSSTGGPSTSRRCAGGLHAYHACLPERDVIVSAFSLGDRRFGEQLMAASGP